MMRNKQVAVGDVARSLEGFVVSPSVDSTQTHRYFGHIKLFRAVYKQATIVTREIRVSTRVTRTDLERAVQYSNHRSAKKHLRAMWETFEEDIRHACLVMNKSATHKILKYKTATVGSGSESQGQDI